MAQHSLLEMAVGMENLLRLSRVRGFIVTSDSKLVSSLEGKASSCRADGCQGLGTFHVGAISRRGHLKGAGTHRERKQVGVWLIADGCHCLIIDHLGCWEETSDGD